MTTKEKKRKEAKQENLEKILKELNNLKEKPKQ